MIVAAAVMVLSAPAPAAEDFRTAVEALDARLLAGPTATIALEHWCADRGLADPARVHAEVLAGPPAPASVEQRRRLGVGRHEPLGYRRVRLKCGAHVLSEAENWYVPARLTPEMRRALAETDTPFGTVIAPLGPKRRSLGVERLWQPRAAGETPPHALLRHRALVFDRHGRALAEVVETYVRGALGLPD